MFVFLLFYVIFAFLNFKTLAMKRFSKAIAAIILMTSAFFAASCNKSDDTNDGGGHTGTFNGHEYVDLGLPSGTKWATCNVGANTPEGLGDFFAWGETEPKNSYNLDTYRYYVDGEQFQITKYCTNPDNGYNGFTDNLTTLLSGDDAATVKWGGGWYTPTKDQWMELLINTTYSQTTKNGVKGNLFTAKNGSSIFLPAAGSQWWEEVSDSGVYGCYWSSVLDTNYSYLSWLFYCGPDETLSTPRFDNRAIGMKVRPVCNSK